MFELVKFLASASLLLLFAVGLAIPGVASLRAGDTTTGVVLLLFVALFVVAVVGNAIEYVERRANRRRVAAPSPARTVLPPGTPSNAGSRGDAFFITDHGSATGYHFTDKLTPDGVLAGYRHDDFSARFEQTYGVVVDAALVERVFACVRSPEYAALPDQIADPRIADGHVLKLTARIDGRERVIWLANTTHALLSPLVAAVRACRPAVESQAAPSDM